MASQLGDLICRPSSHAIDVQDAARLNAQRRLAPASSCSRRLWRVWRASKALKTRLTSGEEHARPSRRQWALRRRGAKKAPRLPRVEQAMQTRRSTAAHSVGVQQRRPPPSQRTYRPTWRASALTRYPPQTKSIFDAAATLGSHRSRRIYAHLCGYQHLPRAMPQNTTCNRQDVSAATRRGPRSSPLLGSSATHQRPRAAATRGDR